MVKGNHDPASVINRKHSLNQPQEIRRYFSLICHDHICSYPINLVSYIILQLVAFRGATQQHTHSETGAGDLKKLSILQGISPTHNVSQYIQVSLQTIFQQKQTNKKKDR